MKPYDLTSLLSSMRPDLETEGVEVQDDGSVLLEENMESKLDEAKTKKECSCDYQRQLLTLRS